MGCIIKHRLDGKVAVVTASTDGIGFAIAERLALEGAKVVISSRKQENVDAAVAKLKAQNLDVIGLVCHVAKAGDRKGLYKEAYNKFGGIDILVSNAAVNTAPPFMFDCSEREWDKIFDVNLKSSFFLTKEVLPYFQKRGGGKIIYISTVAAYCVPRSPEFAVYCVSKTALNGLTKVAAKALAGDNITVNCIAPGPVITKFVAKFRNEDSEKKINANIPMGRFGYVHEISGIAAFLSGSDGNFITGETIIAAGGISPRL